GVTTVLIGPMPHRDQATALYQTVLGRAPERIAGVELWRLDQGPTEASSDLGFRSSPYSMQSLEGLVCPKCHEPLTTIEAGRELRCVRDGSRYPLVDGIPSFLMTGGDTVTLAG